MRNYVSVSGMKTTGYENENMQNYESPAEECCRSREILKDKPFSEVSKIDTAENGLFKVCQKS